MRLSAVPAILSIFVPQIAFAFDPPKDDFLDPPRPGLYAHADALTIGVQGTLEHRKELDGDLIMLSTRLNALGSLGYADGGAHADLRVTYLSFGGSVGYRNVFRHYPGGDTNGDGKLTRGERVTAEKDGTTTQARWPWAEARSRLVVPLDFLWLVGNAAFRWEDAPAQSFDWFHTNVHDGGRLFRADATLFYRHPRLGGVGPTVRYMSLPRGDGRADEIAFGLTLGTRPVWRRDRDLLLVQTLYRNDPEFGFHVLRAPLFVMVVYRMSFGLSVPPRDL